MTFKKTTTVMNTIIHTATKFGGCCPRRRKAYFSNFANAKIMLDLVDTLWSLIDGGSGISGGSGKFFKN